MTKFMYRLWFPQVGVHGSVFDKICEECQDKIEETIADGFVLPTTVGIDNSMGLSIRVGFKFKTIDLCDKCAKKFKEWIDAQEYLHFNDKQVELWRNSKAEEA